MGREAIVKKRYGRWVVGSIEQSPDIAVWSLRQLQGTSRGLTKSELADIAGSDISWCDGLIYSARCKRLPVYEHTSDGETRYWVPDCYTAEDLYAVITREVATIDDRLHLEYVDQCGPHQPLPSPNRRRLNWDQWLELLAERASRFEQLAHADDALPVEEPPPHPDRERLNV